jgi:predicted membrane chloride channel (bestrophin family)
MIIAILSTFLATNFNIVFHVDLTLLSIAIVFPLVFAIRGSFRRREKALGHLSKFRSALQTVHYFIMSNPELTESSKSEMTEILEEISEETMDHLATKQETTAQLDEIIDKVQRFMNTREEVITKSLKDRIFRFMQDLHESIENLHAINIHRTPIVLKAYCKFFIYIFPLVYAPTVIFNLGPSTSVIIAYGVVIFTQFILISLYNIQDQLENPFDDDGPDDIKLDTFKFNR